MTSFISFYWQLCVIFQLAKLLFALVKLLIGSSESECGVTLNGYNENKMIVNSGKFQAIITNKRKQDHTH